MAIVKATKLERIHTGTCEAFLLALKGTPLLDPNGSAVLDAQGQAIYVPPTAAMMGKIIEFLADNGIDSEPLDGTPVDSVVKKLTHFDGDPLYLEAPGTQETLPETD